MIRDLVWAIPALAFAVAAAFVIVAKRVGMDRQLIWRTILGVMAALLLVALALTVVGRNMMA